MRYCITQADKSNDAASQITFQLQPNQNVITIGMTVLPTITKNITITGPVANQLTVQGTAFVFSAA